MDSDRLHPAEEWFKFSPATLQLEPGERQTTEVTLTVPHNAEYGDYEALIVAQIAADGDGATVGAAAASRLTFTVEDPPFPLDVPDGWCHSPQQPCSWPCWCGSLAGSPSASNAAPEDGHSKRRHIVSTHRQDWLVRLLNTRLAGSASRSRRPVSGGANRCGAGTGVRSLAPSKQQIQLFTFSLRIGRAVGLRGQGPPFSDSRFEMSSVGSSSWEMIDHDSAKSR
jgi:hypothetical protein